MEAEIHMENEDQNRNQDEQEDDLYEDECRVCRGPAEEK
jgi:hypothetical protein